jgi:transposase
MLLHQLLDEAGGDRAEAARRVGVGRTTMYRWIKAGLLDQPIETIQARYTPRPASATKLEKYTALIEARLAEFPRLSGTRLLAECRAAGYAGGVTQLPSASHKTSTGQISRCFATKPNFTSTPSQSRPRWVQPMSATP